MQLVGFEPPTSGFLDRRSTYWAKAAEAIAAEGKARSRDVEAEAEAEAEALEAVPFSKQEAKREAKQSNWLTKEAKREAKRLIW